MNSCYKNIDLLAAFAASLADFVKIGFTGSDFAQALATVMQSKQFENA